MLTFLMKVEKALCWPGVVISTHGVSCAWYPSKLPPSFSTSQLKATLTLKPSLVW